jgi:hypothetical protein
LLCGAAKAAPFQNAKFFRALSLAAWSESTQGLEIGHEVVDVGVGIFGELLDMRIYRGINLMS